MDRPEHFRKSLPFRRLSASAPLPRKFKAPRDSRIAMLEERRRAGVERRVLLSAALTEAIEQAWVPMSWTGSDGSVTSITPTSLTNSAYSFWTINATNNSTQPTIPYPPW